MAPGFTQPGVTGARLGAVFFIDSATIPELAALPRNIGATTLNTSPINVCGYNTFFALLEATVSDVTLKINAIDPRDQTTILFTRTVLAVVAGTGLIYTAGNFGGGSGAAGNDVHYFISLGFTGAGANATINQFPGLWGSAR
jgi:hypothetical protein